MGLLAPGLIGFSIKAGPANRNADAPLEASRSWPRTSPLRRLAERPLPRPHRRAQVAAQCRAPGPISRTRTQPRFTLSSPCKDNAVMTLVVALPLGSVGDRPATDWSRNVARRPALGRPTLVRGKGGVAPFMAMLATLTPRLTWSARALASSSPESAARAGLFSHPPASGSSITALSRRSSSALLKGFFRIAPSW